MTPEVIDWLHEDEYHKVLASSIFNFGRYDVREYQIMEAAENTDNGVAAESSLGSGRIGCSMRDTTLYNEISFYTTLYDEMTDRAPTPAGPRGRNAKPDRKPDAARDACLLYPKPTPGAHSNNRLPLTRFHSPKGNPNKILLTPPQAMRNASEMLQAHLGNAEKKYADLENKLHTKREELTGKENVSG